MQMQAESKVPVFVFPRKLLFQLQDKNTHKQILTLYNPYDFPVKYKVLGTSPNKYIIVNPEGVISSHFRTDILIRHNEIVSSNCDVTDKFRIQLYDNNTKQILGKQDVLSILKANLDNYEKRIIDDAFEHITSTNNEFKKHVQSPIVNEIEANGGNISSSPNYLVVIIAIICFVGLFIPTDKDESPFFGFHISIALKLICSYILGLVTTVIFKP